METPPASCASDPIDTGSPPIPAKQQSHPLSLPSRSTTATTPANTYALPPATDQSSAGETAPPLPPRPLSMVSSSPTPPRKRESALHIITPVVHEDTGPFSPRVFISKYIQALPLRISVERGYHGGNERASIAMGDVYDVHFVKHNKVAVLKDSYGTEYNIPLSSPVEFAPLFKVTNDPGENTSGVIFERVSDIMAHKPLPKIVRVQKANSKSSVEKNEILIVHKVQQPPMRKKTLLVYSITHGREKTLPSDCVASFTSDPYANRLHLPDIVSHFQGEFPLDVKVVMTDIEITNSDDFDLSHLISEVSKLTEVRTETSLIVSTYLETRSHVSEEEQTLIEIPIDLPIEVSILQPEKKEETVLNLFHRTKRLYEGFDPSRIRSIRAGSSASDLCTALRKGYEREGMELQRPERVYDIIRARQQLPAQSPVDPRHSQILPHKEVWSLKSGSQSSKSKPNLLAQSDSQRQTKITLREQGTCTNQRESSPSHVYQSLLRPALNSEAVYETMHTTPGKDSRESQSKDFSLEMKRASPLIKHLIGRIETLEKQVSSLHEELAKLKKQ